TIIGADLVLNSNRAFTEDIKNIIDSLGGEQSQEVSFASMVLFPKNQGTRLVQVRALKGDFPYYGAIETTPIEASRSFRSKQKALVDQTLMLQFDAKSGDTVRVGELSFLIEGDLQKVPGQPGIASTVAPPVYIPMTYLESTGLMKKGSRVQYRHYFKFPEEDDVQKIIDQHKDQFERESVGYSTVKSTKEGLGNAFSNLTKFLSFVAFAALLLGCVGVASAVHIYVKEKLNTVAVFRCLGISGKGTLYIYLIQIVIIGLLGSILGAALGSFIQVLLPYVMEDFLPVEISLSISWDAIFSGILVGLSISVLFALLPLLPMRKISPLRALRASYEGDQSGRDPIIWLVYLGILSFIFGFIYWQNIGGWQQAAVFTLALVISFAFLAGIAQLTIWLVRKFFPRGWSYIWRQGLANLYRPQNQTLILMIAIGLGTALVVSMFLVQNLLLSQVAFSSKKDQPNMVLFDIQTEQTDSISALTKSFDLPLIQEVPVVTMQLQQINGIDKLKALEDSTIHYPKWGYNREYRVTYRDNLISSEKITKGDWISEVKDTIFISMEEGFARGLKVDIGDELLFNVQGALITTVVGSLRKVEWNRVQTNFLVLFPTGVLEAAPKFHVVMTKVDSKQTSAKFQQAVVNDYPNISIIDLGLILETVNDIIDKVGFVIRFMAMFSIITGVIVLISSVVISKFQRIKESVLLRTIGAQRKQVLQINALEYFFLGSLATGVGIIISLIAAWALARFSFEIPFQPKLLPVLVIYLVITGMTVLIGMLNSRGILNRPPLEVLRQEV
ncbi:MAG: ABC transporter permease, partial [Cyclobacteriaceae bacterium]